jgi:phage-related protein
MRITEVKLNDLTGGWNVEITTQDGRETRTFVKWVPGDLTAAMEAASSLTADTDFSWLPKPDECGMCGEAYADHRPASGNTAPFCMSRESRPGDTFIRGRK